MPVINEAYCQTKVQERDRKGDSGRGSVPGLMIVRSPTAGTSFTFRYINPVTRKRDHEPLGDYDAETNSLDRVRQRAIALRGRVERGENIKQTQRAERAAMSAEGLTVGQLIDLRIEFMKADNPVVKADGNVRPRVETWRNVAGHLNRFIRPELGRMLAKDVTNHDLAVIQNKLSENYISNARHFRRAATSMFKWAAEAGRQYIPCSPCHGLPKLVVEESRDRHLEAHELRTLWRGLDGANRWGIKTRLAIKFQLATMLRSAELIALHTSEIVDLDGEKPYAKIPLGRVKKRRVIEVPLSPLAVEIIKEALGDRKESYVFCNPRDPNEPLHRQAAAGVLHGRKKNGNDGLCAFLGLSLFTPHDLRRTAATIAGDLGFRQQLIELCLDHQKQATVTIYDRSERREKKRKVLDAVADEIRRIVADEPEMRLAA